jgi:hypothetical protein
LSLSAAAATSLRRRITFGMRIDRGGFGFRCRGLGGSGRFDAVVLEELAQLALRQYAGETIDELAALDQEHGGDRAHLERGAELLLLVDIDLGEHEGAVVFAGQLLETGPSCLHGPHHSAQKSTRTGVSSDLRRTSASKFAAVASNTWGWVVSRVISGRRSAEWQRDGGEGGRTQAAPARTLAWRHEGFPFVCFAPGIQVCRYAAVVAALLFTGAALVMAARVEGYSHVLHPLALLGAKPLPGAGLFNLLAFVLPGALVAWVAWRLRGMLPAAARWPARIGAQLLLLSALAFALQGVLPLDAGDLDGVRSARHAAAWMVWWIAFATGGLLLARGLRGADGWRRSRRHRCSPPSWCRCARWCCRNWCRRESRSGSRSRCGSPGRSTPAAVSRRSAVAQLHARMVSDSAR